ncbi:MFS transporter [Pseudovibrio sp. SPO723]|uniref:MFS transporter n=1 Tax=Nesiotobacter zosterae TaxID=392721 RepID=UPI0029C194D2|nr:MFS transporter [Pseudovibrio sp. SPO723]MDX5593971.1 MFS transporter [Pseudovibrio sp. SPO723]
MTHSPSPELTEDASSTASVKRPHPFLELVSSPYLLSSTLICLGVGSHAVNGIVSNAVLPSIIRDIGGQDRAFWIFSLFQVASIMSGTVTGTFKGRLGARSLFVLASLILAAGSLLAGAASNLELLLVGRFLQGFGEGMIVAVIYAVIPQLFPERLVATVFSMTALVWAMAAGVGPIAAGALTETWSWRAAYYVNLPLVLVLLVLAVTAMPKEEASSQKTSRKDLDMLPRLGLIALAILIISFVGEVRSVAEGALYLVGGMVLLFLARAWDRVAASPFIPKTAFQLNSIVGLVMWIMLLTAVSASVRMVYGNAILQSLWGLGVTEAAYAMATLAFAWTIAAWFVANTQDAKARARLISIGISFIALALATMALSLHLASLPLFVFACILSGVGSGLSNQFLTRSVMFSSSQEDRDRASGILPTLTNGGIAIGAALASLLAAIFGMSSTTTEELVTAQAATSAGPTVFGIMAILSAIAALLSFRLRKHLTG